MDVKSAYRKLTQYRKRRAACLSTLVRPAGHLEPGRTAVTNATRPEFVRINTHLPWSCSPIGGSRAALTEPLDSRARTLVAVER